MSGKRLVSPIVKLVKPIVEAEEAVREEYRPPAEGLAPVAEKLLSFNYDSLPWLELLGYRDIVYENYVFNYAVLSPEKSMVKVADSRPGWIHNIAIRVSDGGTGVGFFVFVEGLAYIVTGMPWMLRGPVVALWAEGVVCGRGVYPCILPPDLSPGIRGNYYVVYQTLAKPTPMPRRWSLVVRYPTRAEIAEWREKLNAMGKTDLVRIADYALRNYGSPVTVYYYVQYSMANPEPWMKLSTPRR